MEAVVAIKSRCEFVKESYSCSWLIENFNLIPFLKDHPVFGPSIRLGKRIGSTWQLLLCKDKEDNGEKLLGFRLVKSEENTVWDACEYSVSLKSTDGKVSLKYIDHVTVGAEYDSSFEYCETKDKGDLPNSDENVCKQSGKKKAIGKLELDSIFGIQDLIVVLDIGYVYSIESVDEPLEESQEKLVINDLKSLYESQKFSDIVLCAGEAEFPVHRNILATRAVGFDNLLHEKSHLGQLQEFQLDVSEPVAKMMLTYIYTGEFPIEIDTNKCYQLYKAACMYGISNLKELCLKTLKEMSKHEPVCNDCRENEGPLLTLANAVNDIAEEINVISKTRSSKTKALKSKIGDSVQILNGVPLDSKAELSKAVVEDPSA